MDFLSFSSHAPMLCCGSRQDAQNCCIPCSQRVLTSALAVNLSTAGCHLLRLCTRAPTGDSAVPLPARWSGHDKMLTCRWTSASSDVRQVCEIDNCNNDRAIARRHGVHIGKYTLMAVLARRSGSNTDNCWTYINRTERSRVHPGVCFMTQAAPQRPPVHALQRALRTGIMQAHDLQCSHRRMRWRLGGRRED